jgi:hypothetical protein
MCERAVSFVDKMVCPVSGVVFVLAVCSSGRGSLALTQHITLLNYSLAWVTARRREEVQCSFP